MIPPENRPEAHSGANPRVPPARSRAEREAAANQARADAAWRDTAGDITVGDMVRAREAKREVRIEILLLVAAALLVLVVGIVWSVNVRRHDRLVAQETAAGQQTPYVPDTDR